LRRKSRQILDPPASKATLEDDGLPLHVAEFPHPGEERSIRSFGSYSCGENADTRHLPRLLCLAHKRRDEKQDSHNGIEPDGGPSDG
jgi:hypothetical protein